MRNLQVISGIRRIAATRDLAMRIVRRTGPVTLSASAAAETGEVDVRPVDASPALPTRPRSRIELTIGTSGLTEPGAHLREQIEVRLHDARPRVVRSTKSALATAQSVAEARIVREHPAGPQRLATTSDTRGPRGARRAIPATTGDRRRKITDGPRPRLRA